MESSQMLFYVTMYSLRTLFWAPIALAVLAIGIGLSLREPRRSALVAVGVLGLALWLLTIVVARAGVSLVGVRGEISRVRGLLLYVSNYLPYLVLGCVLLAVPERVAAVFFSVLGPTRRRTLAGVEATRVWVSGLRALSGISLLFVVAGAANWAQPFLLR